MRRADCTAGGDGSECKAMTAARPEPAASNQVWDAIIIGGGPAGAIAALTLARRGRSAIILEKSGFPRPHVGESFLPPTLIRLQQLGLEPALRRLPHVPKFGATFIMADGRHPLEIDFIDGYCHAAETFNAERCHFDAMLLSHARQSGAQVCQNAAVTKILALADGDVRLATEAGEIRGRYLLDASGQATVVARHLGTRRPTTEPYLRKVAYFNHFQNVLRPPPPRQGHPQLIMAEEGWFWMIPLSDDKTSVGMVLDVEFSRRIQREQGIAPDRMLRWGIAHAPLLRQRMRDAAGPQTNQVAADFSYRCRPCAGEGYFLLGDAAAFMDPIFSSGIAIAIDSGATAANLVDDLLAGRLRPAAARARFTRRLLRGTRPLFRIIGQYYDHSFRELLLNRTGPLAVHRAVIALLAGDIFPRLAWKVRWRLQLFNFFVWANRRVQLVQRRERFSLLEPQSAPPAAELASPDSSR
jgi:flavin-dependent dehydrogenase